MLHLIVKTVRTHADYALCNLSNTDVEMIPLCGLYTWTSSGQSSFVMGSDTPTIMSQSTTYSEPKRIEHSTFVEILYGSYVHTNVKVCQLGDSLIYVADDNPYDRRGKTFYDQEHRSIANCVGKMLEAVSFVDYQGNFLYHISDRTTDRIYDTRIRITVISGITEQPDVYVANGDSVYLHDRINGISQSVIYDYREQSHTAIVWPVKSDFREITCHDGIRAKFINDRMIQVTNFDYTTMASR